MDIKDTKIINRYLNTNCLKCGKLPLLCICNHSKKVDYTPSQKPNKMSDKKNTPIMQAIESVKDEISIFTTRMEDKFVSERLQGEYKGRKEGCEFILKILEAKLPTERETIEQAWLDGAYADDGTAASDYFNNTFKTPDNG